jgi:hypothetical protein
MLLLVFSKIGIIIAPSLRFFFILFFHESNLILFNFDLDLKHYGIIFNRALGNQVILIDSSHNLIVFGIDIRHFILLASQTCQSEHRGLNSFLSNFHVAERVGSELGFILFDFEDGSRHLVKSDYSYCIAIIDWILEFSLLWVKSGVEAEENDVGN